MWSRDKVFSWAFTNSALHHPTLQHHQSHIWPGLTLLFYGRVLPFGYCVITQHNGDNNSRPWWWKNQSEFIHQREPRCPLTDRVAFCTADGVQVRCQRRDLAAVLFGSAGDAPTRCTHQSKGHSGKNEECRKIASPSPPPQPRPPWD